MDLSQRQITKIAREAAKLTLRMMKETGIGTGEFDLIHAVRHNPGISQKEVCTLLNMDKGAVARRVASLEGKGYLVRRQNPADSRGQMLYATEQAESLKRSKVSVETAFYEWLLEGLSSPEQEVFTSLLHTLYVRSKAESRSGFPHVTARLSEEESV